MQVSPRSVPLLNGHPSLGLMLLGALVCLLTPAAHAQVLPKGKARSVRERTYDISHYAADLEIAPEQKSVRGRATIELSPVVRIDSVTLDAIGLAVERVTLLGVGAVRFGADGHHLRIELPEPRAAGEELTLEVSYSARPRSGMLFQRDPGNARHVFVHTYGEGGSLANWLPIYNDVNDKFSSEMRVTVPRPYVVVSNGVLVETNSASGDRMTYHWKQDKPHSNYLIAIYAGDFERGQLPPTREGTPLAYWVPRGRLAEGAYAFRNTTRMVEFFSRRFNYPYPWDKYDQIAIPDYAIGAMEHTGVTGHNASVLRLEGAAPNDFGRPTFDEYDTDWTAEATISHELAHHWFGDTTTCRSLGLIWLNESFASYLMMLWAEESLGHDQLLFDVDLARRHYFRFVVSDHLIRPLEYWQFDSPDDIYNEEHSYLKGAAVLHMARRILGDEPFFRSLSRFLHDHEFDNVDSHDLLIAIEQSTGRNLEWFFDDWVHGGGHPKLEIAYRYLESEGKVALRVAQVQPLVEGQGLFRLPVKVTIAIPERTWQESILVKTASETFLLDSPQKPLMVSFDGQGDLVAEIDFDKPPDELAYQAAHDALPGRLRALRRLASVHPARPETAGAFEHALEEGNFWGMRAEAARLLGAVRSPAVAAWLDMALRSPDYRIRKAAVLALPETGMPSVEKLLLGRIEEDPHPDVVGTAIVALARTNPEMDAAILRKQLGRDSWYDEIRMATLRALGMLKRKELTGLLRPYVDEPYNQDVRRAALAAWTETAPGDSALHAKLTELAGGSTYSLQQFAIDQIGKLYVKEAAPVLRDLAAADFDENLTAKAEAALEEIGRLQPQ